MYTHSNIEKYERKLTALERLFSHSPYASVMVAARVKGHITEKTLSAAVLKVQQKHINLRVRIQEREDHIPCFTTDGVGELLVEIVPRVSDDHWIKVVLDAAQSPYDFEARPPIRFILVHSPEISEMIILSHHIICDGLSLAYLARDLLMHLGDPAIPAAELPAPPPIGLGNVPDELSLNGLLRFVIGRINKQWQADPTFFDLEDYKALSEGYWKRYAHQTIPIEFSKDQTSSLVKRCREESVTVNSALAAAFLGAQVLVLGEKGVHPEIGAAADVRDRLSAPVGETMGFYAAVARLKFKYNARQDFWENARRLHRKMVPLFANKPLFKDFLNWLYLDGAVLEAINFKKLGGLVDSSNPRYKKLTDFARKQDVVLSLLKRDKMESLKQVIMGTAITNLGRLEFPTNYGELELDRLILKPGGAFPMVNVNLVLSAVTAAGKLSLLIEFVEDNIDFETMQQIKTAAVEFLTMM